MERIRDNHSHRPQQQRKLEMEAKILPSSLISKASTFLPRNPSPSLRTLAALHSRHCRTLRATENENNTNTTESNVEADNTSSRAEPITLNIRRLSRRQARQLEVEQNVSRAPPAPPPRKDWESMTLAEKAVELYVGEKGLLFWLNKFAYASIFIVIGGWILFRFVGPSLGLYQLDAPPLPPSSLLKGQS